MEDSFTLPKLLMGTPIVMNPSAQSTTLSQAHNLTNTPIFFVSYIECVIAESGYVVGDRVFLDNNWPTTVSGYVISADSANMYLTTPNSGPIQLISKTTPAGNIAGTTANWKIVAIPYALASVPGEWI